MRKILALFLAFGPLLDFAAAQASDGTTNQPGGVYFAPGARYFAGHVPAQFLLHKPRMDITGRILAKTNGILSVLVSGQNGLQASGPVEMMNCPNLNSSIERICWLSGCPRYQQAQIGDTLHANLFVLDHQDSDNLCLLKGLYFETHATTNATWYSVAQGDHTIVYKGGGSAIFRAEKMMCIRPRPCFLIGWTYTVVVGMPDDNNLKVGDPFTGCYTPLGSAEDVGTNTWVRAVYYDPDPRSH